MIAAHRASSRARWLATLVVVAACKGGAPAAAPRPELIDTIRDLADRTCACGTDKACVRAIRDDEWEPNKQDLQRHGLTGDDRAAYDAELLRLRACGDAAGLTIWL